MIGLIDSGEGGIITAREIRRKSKTLDLTLLIDRKRAPYGTKTKEELIEITRENAERLLSLGAERVLLACCTASTVWKELPTHIKERTIPIIEPTARRASGLTENGRIAVIATEATVRSGKWEEMLHPNKVFALALGGLVALIEGGAHDGHLGAAERSALRDMLRPLASVGADTLILGCTHFPALMGEIRGDVKKYGIKHIVSSAKEGAGELLLKISDTSGHGETVQI